MAVPWSPSTPLTITTSPGRACAAEIATPCGTTPMPAVLTNSLSAGAALDDLGIAGDDGDAGRVGDALHAGDDAAQDVDVEAFLQHRPQEEKRPRAAHRQIVDGAGDRKRADVAAREEQRIDHVGIGGERQPVAVPREVRERQHRLVFQCTEQRIVEGADKDILDQRAHRLAAAAVRHVDVRVRALSPPGDAGRRVHATATGCDRSMRP